MSLLLCYIADFEIIQSSERTFSPPSTKQMPKFWRIRPNDQLLKLTAWEAQLSLSLSSTAPCSSHAHWPFLLLVTKTIMACSTLSWAQSPTVLHTLLAAESHLLGSEKMHDKLRHNLKASQMVDANGQIPGGGKKNKTFQSLFTMNFSATAYWYDLHLRS